MSMNLRYEGGFRSLTGVLWEIEIRQESKSEFPRTQIALTDDPLQIEWTEVDKLEPVQTSKATLSLYSDTDRQFLDLYTVIPGSVRLDVFRKEAKDSVRQLYWSGTLDTELYEEPYAYRDNYGVTLTFSDLGILDRLQWNNKGGITLYTIITDCLRKSGVSYTSLQQHVSTTLSSDPGRPLLTSVQLLGDNFFDEDGESMTVREVLDETLRPFALRLIQKNGCFVVYDLNSIYSFATQKIKWAADDSVLGVDKTYSHVKVAFSPYEHNDLIKAEVKENSIKESASQRTTFHVSTNQTDRNGFYLYLSTSGKGVKKNETLKYFKIDPLESGSASVGVAHTVKKISSTGLDSFILDSISTTGKFAYEVESKPYLIHLEHKKSQDFRLKINLDLLFDVRYNPFEEGGHKKYNCGTSLRDEIATPVWWNFENWCNICYVPFTLNFKTVNGEEYHYENVAAYNSKDYNVEHLGEWKIGRDVSFNKAYLCYYDINDRSSATGLGGWATNKRMIGYYTDALPSNFQTKNNADYIKLPSNTGQLELIIGTGVLCYDYKRELMTEINKYVSWVLYGKSSISLVDKYKKEIPVRDVEHSAYIQTAAQEKLEITTKVGTLKETSPTALGQLFKAYQERDVISAFTREGRTDLLERLLIGTIYSNYAGKNIILSGTVNLLPTFDIYSDEHTSGKYILLSETQKLREDESEIKMVLFSKDNYEGIEYE